MLDASKECAPCTVDAETLAVLKELIRLHEHWFRGSAYVSVKFVNDNDAVIKRAKAIIARAA